MQWLSQAFRMLAQFPLHWLLISVILSVLSIGLAQIPYIGAALTNLLAPLFFAGLMLACEAQTRGRAPRLRDLFAGYLHNSAALLTAGGVNMAAQIAIAGIVIALGGEHIAALRDAMMHAPQDPEQISALLQRLMPLFLAGAALALPIVLMMWFVPALLAFHPLSAWAALRLSLIGCMRNFAALFVYSATVFFLVFLALLIPMGIGLLLLLPILIVGSFVAYRDVFANEAAPTVSEQ